jgi:hypothetical protein
MCVETLKESVKAEVQITFRALSNSAETDFLTNKLKLKFFLLSGGREKIYFDGGIDEGTVTSLQHHCNTIFKTTVTPL